MALAMLLCAFIPVSCAQAQTTDYECFLDWMEHPLHPLAPLLKIHTDTLITYKEIASFLYQPNGDPASLIPDKTQSRYVIFPFYDQKGIIGRTYPLLQSKKKSVKLSLDFKYKTENLSYSCIHLYSLGEGENATEIDSIPLTNTDKWTEVHKEFSLRSRCGLQVELEVAGDSVPENLDRLFVDKFMISYQGQNLKKMPNQYPAKPVKPSDMLSLESLMTQPILDKKILGLGETIHGTVSLQDITFDIMKERILHHSCSLILFEMPLEESFSINRYVKNDDRFHLEDIKKILGDDLYSESTVSFLQWVKEYNQSHNNVVTVLGMDRVSMDQATECYLKDFLDVFDRTKSGIWHPLCNAILTAGWEDPLPVFESDDSIKKVLTEEETELFRYSLSEFVHNRGVDSQSIRDFSMFKTANLIMSLYKPETVTIHAHFGHLNYTSNTSVPQYLIDSPSVGYLFKQSLNGDYACIALSANSGRHYDWMKNQSVPLETSPSESLEQNLSPFDMDPVYLPVDGMMDSDWYKIRDVGFTVVDNVSQFGDIVPKKRMDGIIVVKEASPIPSRLHTTAQQMEYFYQRHKELFDKYLQEEKNKNIQQQSNVTPIAVNKKNDTVADSDSIYFACDEMPEMHGGAPALTDYLQRNIHYSQEALDAKKEGMVVVHFVVEKDGSISHPEVIRSVDPSLDAEAVRVITSMPKWKPGKQDGKPVRVYYNIPVQFILNAPQSAPDAQAPGYRA